MMNDDGHRPCPLNVQSPCRVLDQPNEASDVIPTNELLPIFWPTRTVPEKRRKKRKVIIVFWFSSAENNLISTIRLSFSLSIHSLRFSLIDRKKRESLFNFRTLLMKSLAFTHSNCFFRLEVMHDAVDVLWTHKRKVHGWNASNANSFAKRLK